MSYTEKVLQPGESVVYMTGLHWFIYAGAIGFFCIAAAFAIGSIYLAGDAALAALAMAAVFAFAGLLVAIRAAIRRLTTECAVTSQRVIFKQGIIGRHTIEMNRSKVESVDVDQSILGRLFGYGTIQVRGTGGSLEPLPYISHPIDFRSHITVE